MTNPDCFDIYLGLIWDAVTRQIDGLRLYGLGFRCDIAEVGVRALFSFDPATIALVKAPYNALIGLVWDVAGCCAELGEGSVAFFFGEDNLFDLGEIEAAFTLPIVDGLTLSLTATFAMAGTHTLAFGWELEI